MNTIYPLAKDAAWTGTVDLSSDDVRVQLLDDTAVYDATDEFLDDLGAALVGSGVALPGLSMSAGELSSSAPMVTIPSVASGDDVAAAVLYVHTGTPSTSRLVAWIDTNPDTTPIDLTTNGDDIEVGLPDPLVTV
jgi:hypothetical protein